ncbi:hypothetical protein GCM10011613_09550 [Cellvibrio zantedeschiae]|uniref:Uncharacterized protein n=1 Tax=Cellvibrio zantedeschiae TaxID=1237077 RepID=A0ABQ3AXR3_9GAMM|nr:hypothetical protein GCM10011613_09550 [Cellvibrio zantedeschiae]
MVTIFISTGDEDADCAEVELATIKLNTAANKVTPDVVKHLKKNDFLMVSSR